MGKSQETFSKREREKQRMKKQQDKQEKMKDRKSGKEKGKSLEDMMAYLDENGNLTNKPTDPRIKKTFNQEDIQIGVPKQEDRDPELPNTGTITFFNEQKGFGFIQDSDTKERVFFHVNDLASQVKENDYVTYWPGKSPKGPVATQVTAAKRP